MNQIIKLSDNAANRIKEIISDTESQSIGVRVAVKSGGCAGMSYVMEYAKNENYTLNDSPQPQRSDSLGLLNTNDDENSSFL